MESVPLPQLIEEAYQEAQKYQPVKSAQLRYNVGDQPIAVPGDRASLKHAVAEVMLNALQANPNNPRIAVRMQSETDSKGAGWVHIELQDNGTGFTPDAAKKVPEPFYTTRNVGLEHAWTLRPNLLLTSRFGLDRYYQNEQPQAIDPAQFRQLADGK